MKIFNMTTNYLRNLFTNLSNTSILDGGGVSNHYKRLDTILFYNSMINLPLPPDKINEIFENSLILFHASKVDIVDTSLQALILNDSFKNDTVNRLMMGRTFEEYTIDAIQNMAGYNLYILSEFLNNNDYYMMLFRDDDDNETLLSNINTFNGPYIEKWLANNVGRYVIPRSELSPIYTTLSSEHYISNILDFYNKLTALSDIYYIDKRDMDKLIFCTPDKYSKDVMISSQCVIIRQLLEIVKLIYLRTNPPYYYLPKVKVEGDCENDSCNANQ